jgi:hypothetical protein
MKNTKEKVIEALKNYEGTDFVVNEELIEFIESMENEQEEEEQEEPYGKSDNQPWRFVERWYPRYHSSPKITLADDLQKIIDDEEEEGSDAHRLWMEDYQQDLDKVWKDYNKLHVEIYEEAIKAYIESKIKNK